MSTLIFFSGSRRKESYNTRLLEYLADGLEMDFNLEWLEPSEVNWPIFDQELEAERVVFSQVLALHARLLRCDGLIVSSPEYNSLPTPYLKNIVDWVSRIPRVVPGAENPFVDMPIQLCSASTGWSGGALGLIPARSMFAYLGGQVQGDTICIPHAAEAWTELGYAFSERQEIKITDTLRRFLDKVRSNVEIRTKKTGLQ